MKYQEHYLLREVTSSESEHKDIITKYPDAAYVTKQGREVPGKVVNLASCTPVGVGESKDWVRIVHGAKQDRCHLFKALNHCVHSGQLTRVQSCLTGTVTKEIPEVTDKGISPKTFS
jgi:hypothetical protein